MVFKVFSREENLIFREVVFMKINYSLKYVKNKDTDNIIKECFKNKIAVIGNKKCDQYVLNAKGDVWIRGVYKGLAFGKKTAKLVGIFGPF
jgi:hypothetical protein